jgi:hypothetical protein
MIRHRASVMLLSPFDSYLTKNAQFGITRVGELAQLIHAESRKRTNAVP